MIRRWQVQIANHAVSKSKRMLAAKTNNNSWLENILDPSHIFYMILVHGTPKTCEIFAP